MAMVPAICTQCGGKILVDDTHDAGICEFCGTAFVTEKAINNYQNTINIDNATINVANVDVGNLLLRAKSFEADGNREKAIEYYDRVLDIDITNKDANDGMKRLEPKYIGLNPVPQSVCNLIEDYIANKEKVKAIKVVREVTGCSLAAAVSFIDNHESGIWEPYDLDNVYSTKKSSGCYIATSVYGSYDCPQVWTLRRYRDNTLATTWYGRLFIHVYYTLSPTLVKLFGKKTWFKNVMKPTLDRMVMHLNQSGVECTQYFDQEW